MLNLSNVHKIYARIKRDIAGAFQKGNIDRTVSLIDTYASIAQRINDIYRDDDIEECISKIAEEYVGIAKITIIQKENPKKIVFYDQIGTTICLGKQYIQGLLDNGYEIFYIYESPYTPIQNNLLNLLRTESNIKEIVLLNSACDKIKKARELREKIVSFCAEKLIIHSPAFGAFGAIVLSSLPCLTRYRIVPGDHHFYIGYNCIDYYFEFRNFGIQIALGKRNLSPDVLYKLPYYPLITKDTLFQGYPKEIEGKTIIVAAGAEYKFHGSDMYFEMCSHILNKYDHVVILFIGLASEKIKRYIKENHLEGRFIPLGYRTDFSECMKHADILFNSYPFPGGLICQYAAYYSLPILSFSEKEHLLNRSVRGLLGAEEQKSPVSFSDEDKLYEYVDQLLNDKKFRLQEGKRMKSLLQTKEQFDSSLETILTNKCISLSNISLQQSDHEYRTNYYLDLQNHFRIDIINPLLSTYGLYFIFAFSFLNPTLFRQKKYVLSRIVNICGKKYFPTLHKQLKYALKK